MAGHSKWKQIKHKKAATDAKKSKIFGKLASLISVEAKKAKGDVNAPGVRAAVEKAKAENMPNENIERAISKANEQKDLEQITYEGYGPGGTALIIEALTDSRNRASAEVKHLLSKHGGSLGTIGSVTWGFTKNESGWHPVSGVQLTDDDAEKLADLVDALEESDEINAVYTNAE